MIYDLRLMICAKRAGLVLLSSFCFLPSALLGQGSLTPPGAPAPTMKSLDQVEARTAITNSGAVTISQPGSYYLTRNITVSTGNAITIATNAVTLDLNGFTIRSTAGSATNAAILLNSGLRNVAIANGFIESGVTNNGGVYNGRGFSSGITFTGSPPARVSVSGVSVSGCLIYGIGLSLINDNFTKVEKCSVETAGHVGIIAFTINSCSSIDCGDTALQGMQVSDSRGESDNDGIIALTAQNCFGSSGGSGNGIDTRIAQNCYGSASGSGSGVYSETALNCRGYSDTGKGINAFTAQNCYGYSRTSAGVFGFTAQNCQGETDTGFGVNAYYSAENCYGSGNSSGTGINALAVQNCCGRSGSGVGIYCPATASFSYGFSDSSDAMNVGIAIGCYGYSTSGLGLRASLANSSYGSSSIIGNRYNMP
jgi:hypothetical protein